MNSFFSSISFTETVKAATVLFAVIDIIGSIPLILKIKASAGEIYPLRATLVSMGIMIGFLFIGESILALLGVDVKSFAVAGSFILFAMSFEMILGIQLFKNDESPKTASVVPLAFPIIAGAGTMTTLVVLRAEYQAINIVLAIIINVIVVYIVLRLSKKIERLMGPGGMAILKKVFGIILLAIAVKLFTSNLKELF
ncbi:MAG: MarC family protein [Crocinitomicaceae bacterium]